MLAFFGSWALKKYEVERDRWTMWQRREHLKDLKPHHLINRGGVLLEKEFVGFEKYHTSNEDVMNWYKRAFPH